MYPSILLYLIVIILSAIRAAWVGLLSAIIFIIFAFFKIPVIR